MSTHIGAGSPAPPPVQRGTDAAVPPGDPTTVLSVSECLALLRSTDVGRLAIATAAHPEVFPINYVVDHGTVVFRTAEGAKLAGLVRDRQVTFEADGYDPTIGSAWSVVIKGHAEEIQSLHERFDAAGLPLFPWHAGDKHHIVRIAPIETTGRRFLAHPTSPGERDRPPAHRAASE